MASVSSGSQVRHKKLFEGIARIPSSSSYLSLSIYLSINYVCNRYGTGSGSSRYSAYPTSHTRAQNRAQSLQAYQELRHENTSAIGTPTGSGTQRSNSPRSSAQVGPVLFSPDLTSSFQDFQSTSSGYSFFEPGDLPAYCLQAWEGGHTPSLSWDASGHGFHGPGELLPRCTRTWETHQSPHSLNTSKDSIHEPGNLPLCCIRARGRDHIHPFSLNLFEKDPVWGQEYESADQSDYGFWSSSFQHSQGTVKNSLQDLSIDPVAEAAYRCYYE